MEEDRIFCIPCCHAPFPLYTLLVLFVPFPWKKEEKEEEEGLPVACQEDSMPSLPEPTSSSPFWRRQEDLEPSWVDRQTGTSFNMTYAMMTVPSAYRYQLIVIQLS